MLIASNVDTQLFALWERFPTGSVIHFCREIVGKIAQIGVTPAVDPPLKPMIKSFPCDQADWSPIRNSSSYSRDPKKFFPAFVVGYSKVSAHSLTDRGISDHRYSGMRNLRQN
jgi:hypothetical protein